MDYRSHINKQKQYCSWKWVDQCIKYIGEYLDDFAEVQYVTGIPRGGLIPAVLMSHKFGLTYINLDQAKSLYSVEKNKVIVVDDISDTGQTLKQLNTDHFITATLAYRDTSTYLPDAFGYVVYNSDWLVFPWEAEDSVTVQDYLVN